MHITLAFFLTDLTSTTVFNTPLPADGSAVPQITTQGNLNMCINLPFTARKKKENLNVTRQK